MKTSEVINSIHLCPQPEHIDLSPYREIARILLSAANSKRAYIHHGFQEEAEGEEPLMAPPQLLKPIF